jgi:hypothetical protein
LELGRSAFGRSVVGGFIFGQFVGELLNTLCQWPEDIGKRMVKFLEDIITL